MGRSATERSYLSIREVLDLLLGEFPDVTISKIRFLESRGLIHPERTPSGYRKFYEHDVERLRWILRQQREHFLPLKVIKGRLENSPAPSLFDADALVGEAVPEARPAPAPTATGPVASPSGRAGIPTAEQTAKAATPEVGPASPPEPAGSPLPGLGGSPVGAANGAKEAATSRAVPGTGSPPAPPVGSGAVGSAGARSGAPPAPARTVAQLAGLCFSAEELSSACGAEVSLVDELEEFGLVTGRTVAGVRVYDEDDLTVVRVAASLRRFGIEARHLRMFKHAAEREAGLYTQVVTPLLRQRNPDARERAERELHELTELGAELQALFVRAVLRDLTGG